MAKKTWAEKMNDGREPVVEISDKDFAGVQKGDNMLIATPKVVDAYIRNIPRGVHTSLQQMGEDLATEYKADTTCPLTSGIFLRIVAEHAYDEYQQGKAVNKITPFWRMINSKSPTAKKLTFGMDFLKEQRKRRLSGIGKPTLSWSRLLYRY
jgi:hypothetical protein